MTAQESTTSGAVGRATPGWAVVAVTALFGIVYAWDLWEAISTMLELPVFYEAYGYDVAGLPWWVLIVMVVLPIAVFALAVLLGRGRGLLARVVLLLVGLSVVAALTLGLVALETVLRPAILSGLL
jgi:hypothetical protein